ncbi:SCAN domain-containing protein 3 [Trichonephila clavipes]|nr:SCAN domain-containing protein 3 [Trichonephila clavipes]
MASSTKKQKVQDSKCSREFQTWWAEKYGMINKDDKAVCVLCSGTVGEFLKEAWLACTPSLFDGFDNKDKIIQRIKDVPLSRNTMKDRILKLTENVTDQQKNDINSAPFISLCFDESIDITKSARLAVFARYCVGNIIKEELIAITSLLITTKATDICTAVRNSLAEKEIDLKRIVSVTTDGAPNMVVAKIVNLISSQALNKRKFDALLDEVNSVYNGLIMYNNVHWLSRGNVLQRFVDFLEEIGLFLQNESKIEQYPQLMDIMWLLKLMFFTDMSTFQ